MSLPALSLGVGALGFGRYFAPQIAGLASEKLQELILVETSRTERQYGRHAKEEDDTSEKSLLHLAVDRGDTNMIRLLVRLPASRRPIHLTNPGTNATTPKKD